MRKSLLAGGAFAVAAAVAVWLGEFFGLELDSFALLGVALGAVVALVPDGRPGVRLAGFGCGLVVTLIGYAVRAALLPDTTSGRAIAAFIMIALCVLVVAASIGRIPLWSTLLGAGAMFGAYEEIYAAAPPEFTSSSVSTLTSLVFTAGLGFLVASFFAPSAEVHHRSTAAPAKLSYLDDNDNTMERAK